jgi:GAF domain-containing protein
MTAHDCRKLFTNNSVAQQQYLGKLVSNSPHYDAASNVSCSAVVSASSTACQCSCVSHQCAAQFHLYTYTLDISTPLVKQQHCEVFAAVSCAERSRREFKQAVLSTVKGICGYQVISIADLMHLQHLRQSHTQTLPMVLLEF